MIDSLKKKKTYSSANVNTLLDAVNIDLVVLTGSMVNLRVLTTIVSRTVTGDFHMVLTTIVGSTVITSTAVMRKRTGLIEAWVIALLVETNLIRSMVVTIVNNRQVIVFKAVRLEGTKVAAAVVSLTLHSSRIAVGERNSWTVHVAHDEREWGGRQAKGSSIRSHVRQYSLGRDCRSEIFVLTRKNWSRAQRHTSKRISNVGLLGSATGWCCQVSNTMTSGLSLNIWSMEIDEETNVTLWKFDLLSVQSSNRANSQSCVAVLDNDSVLASFSRGLLLPCQQVALSREYRDKAVLKNFLIIRCASGITSNQADLAFMSRVRALRGRVDGL